MKHSQSSITATNGAMMSSTISLKSGSRHCSIKAFCEFHFTQAASARLSASQHHRVRYERLGNDLIALETLEGTRLDIPGRTNSRQHHTRLAACTQRRSITPGGMIGVHGTPPILGGSITNSQSPLGAQTGRRSRSARSCCLSARYQTLRKKLHSAWNDHGQRRFFGRKLSSRDFHREDPLGAPRPAGLPPLRFRPTPDRRRECSDLLLTVLLCSRE